MPEYKWEDLATREGNQILQQALTDAEQRRILARSLTEPFVLMRDYKGVGRKILAAGTVDAGEIPYIDKDPEFTATVIAENSLIPRQVVETTRVILPLNSFAVKIVVSFKDAATVSWNKLDFEKNRAAAKLAEIEDYYIFKALCAAASGAGNLVDSSGNEITGALSKSALLANLIAQTQQYGEITQSIVVSPYLYTALLTWGREDFDPVTQREVLQSGIVGKLFNATVYVSKLLSATPPGYTTIYTTEESTNCHLAFSLPDPMLVGAVLTRGNAEIIEDPTEIPNLSYAWVGYEFAGIGVAYNENVAAMSYAITS